MLGRLKQCIPSPLLQAYHYTLARVAEVKFGHPSDKLIVIGVTGTNGKSSTVNFTAQLLTELGQRVGYTSTAGFSIAGKFVENRLKMTMPGRFALQRLVRQMVDDGCRYAILETSSQGLVQHRHLGVNYDVAVFTNLTPEHIEAHGGFENYKQAKGILFQHLMSRPRKVIDGLEQPKVSVINADDSHGAYYKDFPADRHVTYGWHGAASHDHMVALTGEVDATGSTIMVNGEYVRLPLTAEFERLNALTAVATVYALGFPLADVLRAAERLKPVAGRFERIDLGQPFHVIVDYAYEPYALQALYRSIEPLGFTRVIGVHGSAGGGRDVARRPEIGKLAAQHEDVVIVTNEDPYDDDPRVIMEQVAEGARGAGNNEDLHIIEDRQAAIDFAIASACPGDVVLITGKGSEPVMAVAHGQKIPWDDREAARQALKKAGYGV